MPLVRILLDENLPSRLSRRFPAEHAVRTVQSQGWAGMKNGELIRQASAEFDVFITMDHGLAYQQNIANVGMAIIVLSAPSNRLSDLLPLVSLLNTAIVNAKAGEVQRLQIS
jgi:hypothetical protein